MRNLYSILTDQKEEIGLIDPSQWFPRIEEKAVKLDSPLAQVVIGMRRCGKSTLCKKVLIQSGIRFAYVDFEDERLSEMHADELNDVLETLYRIYGEFDLLFMDEVQNVAGWHLFVSRMLRKGMKMLLTGSNANLLSGELSTYLTGRYHEITLYPFSFEEYCHAAGIDTKSDSTKAKAFRMRTLDRYLQTGGLPEIVAGNEGKGYVMSLLNAIIRKDICQRYKIRNIGTLADLADRLLDCFCQEISYSALAEEFDIGSVHTVKNYISYLCEAFLLRVVTKFSYKGRERLNGKKIYAADLAFLSSRTDAVSTENLGWRLENAVLIELLRRTNPEYQQVFYIRQNGFEVDFLIYERGKVLELIQVTHSFDKSRKKLYNREVGGLLKGAAMTGCHRLTLIISEGVPERIETQGEQISVISATEWLSARKDWQIA